MNDTKVGGKSLYQKINDKDKHDDASEIHSPNIYSPTKLRHRDQKYQKILFNLAPEGPVYIVI